MKTIEPEEAQKILFELETNPAAQSIRIDDALSRIAAQDIIAQIQVPPFDRSSWDGFAVISSDISKASPSAPVVLKIIGELPAGADKRVKLMPGLAAKIMTGAPVPQGADCVIKSELTEFTGEYVSVSAAATSGKDIVYAGSDIAAGEMIVSSGTVITPQHMERIASTGVFEFSVYKRPGAAIISTGCELAELGEPLPPAKIYRSGVYMLIGYLKSMGIDAFDCGMVNDDATLLAECIKDAASVSDVVVTTGGAAGGDYDFALRAADMLGAKVLFYKVNMRPGGGVGASILDGKLILSLPGNPGGASAFLLRCAMPYFRKLCGQKEDLA